MKALSEMNLEELWQLFPIFLAKYNPEWPKWYVEEAAVLAEILGDAIVRMRHIGSTSVPGLTAKPTVDILLEVSDETTSAFLHEGLEPAGWMCMAEKSAPVFQLDFCKGYTPLGFAERVFHLHIRRFGDWDEPYFCEYLRTHSDVAQQYVRLKTGLAAKFEHNRDAYTDAKTEFVRKYTAIARLQ